MSSQRPIEGFDRLPGVIGRSGVLRCQLCGAIIAASGLGIGAHRRKHRRELERKNMHPETE